MYCGLGIIVQVQKSTNPLSHAPRPMRNHHIINGWPSLELELVKILAIVGVNIPWYGAGPMVQPPTVTPTPVQCVTIALSIARPR